jgi:predicted DNA-binding transcriptional regulator AlpA
MNMDQVEIERIASALAARIAPVVPIDYQIWDAEMVAGYLSTSVSNFQQYVAPHPNFPRPIRIPNVKGQKMYPRWMAMEVIRYMDECKER